MSPWGSARIICLGPKIAAKIYRRDEAPEREKIVFFLFLESNCRLSACLNLIKAATVRRLELVGKEIVVRHSWNTSVE